MARRSARGASSALIPRSKRYAASELIRRPDAVLRVLIASKLADSSRMFAVPSVTAVPEPPMTPASAMARRGSAMTSIGGRSVLVSSSRVASDSPGRAVLTTTVRSAIVSRSKACSGWPYSIMTKFVTSTMLLIGRWPRRARASWSHFGDSPTFTPAIRLAV